MSAPMCYWCRHFIKNPHDYPKCAAFPEGIPGDILFWEVDHRVPNHGDGGIVFEQDPASTPFDQVIADEVFKTK
jgi:hypothetical protein